MKQFISAHNLLIVGCCIVMLSLLNSCKKGASPEQQKTVDKELPIKVAAYLDKQKSDKQPEKAGNIESLKKYLTYNEAETESLNARESLIVIPVQETFKVVNKLSEKLIVYLVLKQNKEGNIIKSNLAFFIPAGKKHLISLPANTFSAIFNNKTLEVDGLLRFLSVTGRWIYQLDYKEGRLSTVGKIQQKEPALQGGRTTGCTDWYLVTTYHYPDGSTYQTSEYVGRTCDGCSDPMYQSLCPDDGTGGDNDDDLDCCVIDSNIQLTSSSESTVIGNSCGLESIDPSTGNPIKTCSFSWYFNKSTLLWYTWRYRSYETTVNEKENGVWKFKEVNHSSISWEGQKPPCLSFDEKAFGVTPSISADRKKAGMQFNFQVSTTITCIPGNAPTEVTTPHEITWIAQ